MTMKFKEMLVAASIALASLSAAPAAAQGQIRGLTIVNGPNVLVNVPVTIRLDGAGMCGMEANLGGSKVNWAANRPNYWGQNVDVTKFVTPGSRALSVRGLAQGGLPACQGSATATVNIVAAAASPAAPAPVPAPAPAAAPAAASPAPAAAGGQIRGLTIVNGPNVLVNYPVTIRLDGAGMCGMEANLGGARVNWAANRPNYWGQNVDVTKFITAGPRVLSVRGLAQDGLPACQGSAAATVNIVAN